MVPSRLVGGWIAWAEDIEGCEPARAWEYSVAVPDRLRFEGATVRARFTDRLLNQRPIGLAEFRALPCPRRIRTQANLLGVRSVTQESQLRRVRIDRWVG